MDIIAKAAPDIDPERLQQSLQGFRDYMVDTLELIDFTLSNQKNRIIGAVSQENFDQLAMAVAALNSAMGQLSGLPAQVTDMQEQLTALAGQVSAIKGRMDTAEEAIAAMNGTMDSLEARVAALEQASQ